MTLYLSRLRIARDRSVQTIGSLIDPDAREARFDAHHKLIWSAFAGDPDASRDFLWRAEGNGIFLVLSRRPPSDSPLFDPADVKEFAPDLKAGDRLGFVLRANATRTEKTGTQSSSGKERKRHLDLVMDALPPKGADRAGQRMDLAHGVAEAWLARQGERHGFVPDILALEDYSVHRFRRERGARPIILGVLDMTGTLTVRDPDALLNAVAQGFGRAKAFGCGLMLLRRA